MSYVIEAAKLQREAVKAICLSLVGLDLLTLGVYCNGQLLVATEKDGIVKLNDYSFNPFTRAPEEGFAELVDAADSVLEIFHKRLNGGLVLSESVKNSIRTSLPGFGGVFANPMRDEPLMVVYETGHESEVFLKEILYQCLPICEVAMQHVFGEIASEGLNPTDAVKLYRECLFVDFDSRQVDAMQFDIFDKDGLADIICAKFNNFFIQKKLY